MRGRYLHSEKPFRDTAIEAVVMCLMGAALALSGALLVEINHDDPCDDWSDRPLWELKEKAKGGAQC